MAGKCIGASPFNKMLPRCDDVIYKTTVTLVWGQPNSVYLIKMDALNGGARGPGPAASFPGAPYASGERLDSTGRWSYYPCFLLPSNRLVSL